jgi:hypothetical protein
VKTNTNSRKRLWGIYHLDREYAHELGDPLRTVVEARTKTAAEELAARLGFGDPWAHPVTPDEAKQAEWVPVHMPERRQEVGRRITGRMRI